MLITDLDMGPVVLILSLLNKAQHCLQQVLRKARPKRGCLLIQMLDLLDLPHGGAGCTAQKRRDLVLFPADQASEEVAALHFDGYRSSQQEPLFFGLCIFS